MMVSGIVEQTHKESQTEEHTLGWHAINIVHM